jgi:hypothetical protein
MPRGAQRNARFCDAFAPEFCAMISLFSILHVFYGIFRVPLTQVSADF